MGPQLELRRPLVREALLVASLVGFRPLVWSVPAVPPSRCTMVLAGSYSRLQPPARSDIERSVSS